MEKIELTKEYLIDKFVNKKWSYAQIAKDSGWGKCTISLKITFFNLNRKRNLRSLDLNGQIFGWLTVKGEKQYKKKSVYWECECRCGGKTVVSTGNLLSGNTTTCGCAKNRKGEESPSWKGKGLIRGRYWHIIETGAIRRGIYFNLTIDDVWDLYEKQEKKCALTGWEIGFASNTDQTASLDRIDSSQGYIEGNVQWVHKDVNKAKNIYSQEYFIKMCQDIASNTI